MKHQDFAKSLGMAPSQLSERLAGRIVWRIDELWRATDILDIRLADLIVNAEQTAAERFAVPA